MAGTQMKNVVVIGLIVLVILFVVYQYDPSLFGILGSREGFENVTKAGGVKPDANAHGSAKAGQNASPGAPQAAQNALSAHVNKAKMPEDKSTRNELKKEGFADLNAYEGPANFSSVDAPAGCYPRDQLTPSELLPKDMNSVWAEQNPMGPGSLKGKNFLSAGALIGVNTVGQSLRNANLQVRSEPPNPQQAVSIFNQSTISPDISHRPLEIGS